MTIYLGKISDHKNFQYRFLSERSLEKLKARRIAHYRAMIEAIENDTKDFNRYLRYERKLRKMILSERYTYKRLRYLMSKVREMRWDIEEEFGQINGQSVCILPSPKGYAEELWINARNSALAEQHQRWYEERRSKMLDMVRRGEASYDDFCRGCCHRWTKNDVEEWEDDYHHIVHRTWICPDCGEKMWQDEETW